MEENIDTQCVLCYVAGKSTPGPYKEMVVSKTFTTEGEWVERKITCCSTHAEEVGKDESYPAITIQKYDRNKPCPCLSGKKFKKCHGG